MRRLVGIVLAAMLVLNGLWLASDAAAKERKIRVMASSTDMIAIAKEIAGEDRVDGYSPFAGFQEPELWVEEVFPSWLLKASKADLYVRIGLAADIWADVVVEASRNPRIFRGAPGHVDASEGISVIEVPTWKVDRSAGEIHIMGNPHYLLDPLNAKIVARNILAGLIRVFPEEGETFTANERDFERRIDEAMPRWMKAAEPLRGLKMASYHKTWSYLALRFGIDVVGQCEPKPGIEPSPEDIRSLIARMREQGGKIVIRAPVYSGRVPELVARETGAVSIVVPAHVGGAPGVHTYFEFIDEVIRVLNEAQLEYDRGKAVAAPLEELDELEREGEDRGDDVDRGDGEEDEGERDED
mgnify:CR=1 FL=1